MNLYKCRCCGNVKALTENDTVYDDQQPLLRCPQCKSNKKHKLIGDLNADQ